MECSLTHAAVSNRSNFINSNGTSYVNAAADTHNFSSKENHQNAPTSDNMSDSNVNFLSEHLRKMIFTMFKITTMAE